MNCWGFLNWLSACLSHRNHHHPLESHLPCLCLTCAWPLMISTIPLAVRDLLSQAFTVVGHWRGALASWAKYNPLKWPFFIPFPAKTINPVIRDFFSDRRWRIWNDYENCWRTRTSDLQLLALVMAAIHFLCGLPGGGCPCSSDCSRLGARSI